MLRGLYSRHVREALETPTGFGSDAILLALVLSIFGAPLDARPRDDDLVSRAGADRSTRSGAVPKYTVLSLARGFAAYFLSLAFTLDYGTYAAHNRRAEAIMIPVLDVLQAIPVLGFLPGLVLARWPSFPGTSWGSKWPAS